MMIFGLFADLSTAIHRNFARNRMKSGHFDESYARPIGAIPSPPARALLLGRACSAAGTPEGSYSFRGRLGGPLAGTGQCGTRYFYP